MKVRHIKSLIFASFGVFYAGVLFAATSLFSNYGQIQNVQNYSTNPFWTPTSPYNKRLPQPVYVQGADLNAGDCMNVVQSLVSVQCMTRDNCKDTSLADIRPAVMVQLSNLTGHNYVSACSGYIDSAYEEYVSKFGNQLPSRNVAFPTATTPNTGVNSTVPTIKNPYEQQTPQWQSEINQRAAILTEAQKNNPGEFPETIDDFSFSERMENASAGYLPYKDKKAYQIPKFINKEEYCDGDGKGSEECTSKKTIKKKKETETNECKKYNANTERYSCCLEEKKGNTEWKDNKCKCKESSLEWKDKQCKNKETGTVPGSTDPNTTEEETVNLDNIPQENSEETEEEETEEETVDPGKDPQTLFETRIRQSPGRYTQCDFEINVLQDSNPINYQACSTRPLTHKDFLSTKILKTEGMCVDTTDGYKIKFFALRPADKQPILPTPQRCGFSVDKAKKVYDNTQQQFQNSQPTTKLGLRFLLCCVDTQTSTSDMEAEVCMDETILKNW